MAGDAELLEKMRAAAQGVLGKNGIAESGFNETLDGFGVAGFHDDAWGDADFGEKAVDDVAHVAGLWIEEERDIGELRGADGSNLAAANFVGGGADDEELLVEEGNDTELGLGDGKGDEGEVETAVKEAGDHFFGDADSDADFGVGKALAKLAERTAQLVDQGSASGGEVKGADVLGDIVFEGLVNLAHHGDDLLGEFGEAQGGRGGDEALAAADEELGAEVVGEIVELEADGSGGEVNFFGRTGHAGGVHNGQKEFELVDVHRASSRLRPQRAAARMRRRL